MALSRRITDEHTEQTVINFERDFLGDRFWDKSELTQIHRMEKVYAFILSNYTNPDISQAKLAKELNDHPPIIRAVS